MNNLLFRLAQHLLEGDCKSVAAAFPGPVALNTPLTGAIDGRHALETWFAGEGRWWRERAASTSYVVGTEDERLMAVELVVQLQHEGRAIALPMALLADKAAGGFGQVRVYHSTWPLSGKHKLRAPIVWPVGALHEPPVVERYFRDIGAAADKDAVLRLFTPEAYVREPAGDAHRHAGAPAREHFYANVLADGGVGLTHARAVFDGRLFAVEYLCDAWGTTRFAPQAGCAFYELSSDGERIAAVRIYDDVTPPGE